MSSYDDPESPCIGYCSTALGDDVCRGCGRTFDEVNQWVFLSEMERRAITRRCRDQDWTIAAQRRHAQAGRETPRPIPDEDH